MPPVLNCLFCSVSDESICSSSVGVYFMGLCHKVERVGLERTSRIVTSLSCPRIDVDQPEGSENSCHHHEVFEWMGALACGVDMYEFMPFFFSLFFIFTVRFSFYSKFLCIFSPTNFANYFQLPFEL